MKIAKVLPSAATYNPDKKYSVPFGKSSKADGIDFLSEVQYLGVTKPAPASYNPNKEFVMRRSTSFNIKRLVKENLDWKPKKTKNPDVGSYEVAKSVTFIKTLHPNYTFPK